jgi:dTDP-4-dehydrorhamnose 3,5-epimerase
MEFIPNDILNGLYLIKPFHYEDERGSFVKTFHKASFAERGLETEFEESFYSESTKGVIRGMHFQLPPCDHAKLVFATSGEVLDVVLDLRKNEGTYGRYQSFQLSAENKHMLYIPSGMAHGFCALTDRATLFYFTGTMHSKTHDCGVRYDSFGFPWPVENPIASERDRKFLPLGEFDSPF